MRHGLQSAALVGALVACASAPERGPAVQGAAAATPVAARGADLEARLEAARRLLGSNDFARADDELTRLVAAMHGDPRPLAARAQARYGLGRRDEAIADLDASIGARDTAEARTLRGRYLGLARRLDEAATDLERAVALEPDNGGALVLLAVVQHGRGDDVESAWAFAEAVKALGRAQAVERFWIQLVFLPPDPVQPQESIDRCSRGRAAAMDGQHGEARREYLNALRYAPQYAWCIANLAESTLALGDPVRAEALLRQAVAGYPPRLDGLRADAQGRLAPLLLARGKNPAEAIRLAREALAARGDRAAVLEALAAACDATGDVACSLDAWQRLLARPHLSDGVRARAQERLAALRTGAAGSVRPGPAPAAPAPGSAPPR
jgi:tetratricopeptide (TPR) repeat protein